MTQPADTEISDTTIGSTHDLLLALAGRVDDDLMSWARELVAVGEEGPALDLLTAALIAETAVLPPGVRAAVVAAGRWSRADLDADASLPPGGAATAHRFGPPDAERVARVAAALPAARLDRCRVWLAWRLTPAGSAPGPLPHAVVLVETAGNAVAEVLTYQLGAALGQAGVPASVEVYPAGAPLPAYHVAALAAGRPLAGAASPAAATTAFVPETAPSPAAPDDPLSGPLRQPLLDPLLDPTIHEDDPLGLGRAPLADRRSPSWADQWVTGGWAGSGERSTDPDHEPGKPDGPTSGRRRKDPPAGSGTTGDAGDGAPSTPPGRRAARHRSDEAPDTGTAASTSDEADPVALARLTGTERALLTQLQAELAARESRPRASRRAGIAGGTARANGNGTGTHDS